VNKGCCVNDRNKAFEKKKKTLDFGPETGEKGKGNLGPAKIDQNVRARENRGCKKSGDGIKMCKKGGGGKEPNTTHTKAGVL